MTQYRKKPLIVEAFQWTGDLTAVKDWEVNTSGFGKAGLPIVGEPAVLDDSKEIQQPEPSKISLDNDSFLAIESKSGVHVCAPGDWVIRGVDGEIYPCRNSVFVKLYDEV